MTKTIGSFSPVSDFGEADWMAPHLDRFLPVLDQMVFFADDCRDGTIEIIRDFSRSHPDGHKIKLFEGKKAGDDESFGRMFNECLWALDTDLAWFLHPDMWVVNPEAVLAAKSSDAIAMLTHVESYAGEPGGQLYRISGTGRADKWKNIYRLRNPDLGCHYYARYPGDPKEDCYFSEITGDEHAFKSNIDDYPYQVEDSGIKVLHFSDVRSFERRYFRMARYSRLNGIPEDRIDAYVKGHPRISFKNAVVMGKEFIFEPAEYPAEFLTARSRHEQKLTSKAH